MPGSESGSRRVKTLWLVAALGLVSFLVFKKTSTVKTIEESNPVRLQESHANLPSPVVPKHEATANLSNIDSNRKNSNSAPTSKDESYSDRFALRKLDLRLPRSPRDLLSHLTEFEEPVLPPGKPSEEGDDLVDGDVTNDYYGYFETSDGKLKRIGLRRSLNHIAIQVEDISGQMNEWTVNNGSNSLKLKNFNNDPYSLVVLFPDQRIMYLKFYTALELPGENYKPRAWIGWILSNAVTKTKTSRVAFIDSGDPDSPEWPATQQIRAIFPMTLRDPDSEPGTL